LWLADEVAAPGLVTAAYQSSNAVGNLRLHQGDAKSAADAAAGWLIG
jgi:hypothetical protein